MQITKEILDQAIKLIIEDKKTILEIANIFGCSYGGLTKALLKDDTYINYSNQSRFDKCLSDIEIIYNKNQSGISIRELAKEYKVGIAYLPKLLKSHGYSVKKFKAFLSKDIIDNAEELIKQGYNLSYIRKQTGHTVEALSRELQKRGYKFRNLPSKEDLIKIHEESVLTGAAISNLAIKYGFHDDTVFYRLKIGYQIERGMGSASYCLTNLALDKMLEEYKIPNLQERNYKTIRANVNHNPFIDLNFDEVQYWLGYIAADGCISDKRGYVSLISTDKDLIDNYAKFINGKNKINVTIPKKGKPQYTYRFINKEVAAYLTDLGLTPRKSMTLKMNIPLTFSFVRGLIDGDGCVSVKSAGSVEVSIISGSFDFLEQVREFLEQNAIKCKVVKNAHLFNLVISSKNNVAHLYKYLYYKASYYLQRKKDKYKCLIDKLNITEDALLSN